MSDKVMLSIHRKYDELIFSGRKTLEIRKTAPRCKGKYIIYMYETKRDGGAGAVVGFFQSGITVITDGFGKSLNDEDYDKARADFARAACLTEDELITYANGATLYGLTVNTPIRFPHPRPLSDFGLTRAPQSWQDLK